MGFDLILHQNRPYDMEILKSWQYGMGILHTTGNTDFAHLSLACNRTEWESPRLHKSSCDEKTMVPYLTMRYGFHQSMSQVEERMRHLSASAPGDGGS
jgi:hypothetical protein